MKTCPNCGAKMKADVNFCTNCGTDLRKVPVDAEVAKQQAASGQREQQMTEPASETRESRARQRSNPQNNNYNHQNGTYAGQNGNNGNPNNQQYQYNGRPRETTGERFTQAIQNFDAHNMWEWFVNSWKHPFAEQNGERWYGWVTLLVEDFLIGLGLYIGEQRVSGAADSAFGTNLMGDSAHFTFGTMIEIILFLLLIEASWIFAADLAYKVIYGRSRDFVQITNHIVQTSNLSAIFVVVYFLFMALMGPAGMIVSLTMLWLSAIFFGMACTVVVIGDPNPVHDKFYGYLMLLALQFITAVILVVIIGSTIASQIGSSLPLPGL